MSCHIRTSDHTCSINVGCIHMLYPNKKTTDILTSHVILQQFCMQLFSFMAGLEHQKNLTQIQIATSEKMENNTTAD
jgi:hypothetical protein